jgi:predicted component of type VI protein secretion system
MKLTLLVLSQGKASGTAIPITLSQFLIGRDPQCQLRPASPLISKRHCAVLVKGGKVFLRDFGSTNGSFVNDEPVQSERQLANGDVLKIGPLQFRVQLEATAPVDKPTPPPKPAAAEAAPPADDEASIADMLLALQDEGGAASPASTAKEEDIPSGTTVMEVPTLPPDGQAGADKPAGPAEKKGGPPPKKEAASSSSAAAALLQKYARRNRT